MTEEPSTSVLIKTRWFYNKFSLCVPRHLIYALQLHVLNPFAGAGLQGRGVAERVSSRLAIGAIAFLELLQIEMQTEVILVALVEWLQRPSHLIHFNRVVTPIFATVFGPRALVFRVLVSAMLARIVHVAPHAAPGP